MEIHGNYLRLFQVEVSVLDLLVEACAPPPPPPCSTDQFNVLTNGGGRVPSVCVVVVDLRAAGSLFTLVHPAYLVTRALPSSGEDDTGVYHQTDATIDADRRNARMGYPHLPAVGGGGGHRALVYKGAGPCRQIWSQRRLILSSITR